MIASLVLLVLGLALSAFFSGAETGFYRVTRARLVIAALGGDWMSRMLLWATNNPAVFVATALVGNNVANYGCSAATVLAVTIAFPGSTVAQLLAPLVLAPLLFIYGELLPKSLFFRAPNRLLRRCAPAFVVAAIVLAPITAILWLFSRLLKLVGRRSAPDVQMVLARRELAEILTEGHAVGLIQPAQQVIAQSALALGGRPVKNFMSPSGRLPRVRLDVACSDALRIARRQRGGLLAVERPDGDRDVVGYVRAIDCLLGDPAAPLPIRSLVTVSENDTYLGTITRMVAASEPIARVVSTRGRTIGFVTLNDLEHALMAE